MRILRDLKWIAKGEVSDSFVLFLLLLSFVAFIGFVVVKNILKKD